MIANVGLTDNRQDGVFDCGVTVVSVEELQVEVGDEDGRREGEKLGHKVAGTEGHKDGGTEGASDGKVEGGRVGANVGLTDNRQDGVFDCGVAVVGVEEL